MERPRLEFIVATFNEEHEITDLLEHVGSYVDHIVVVDDGSIDDTVGLALNNPYIDKTLVIADTHTGLPETVKRKALEHVEDDAWVLMLDADERFAPDVLDLIVDWLPYAAQDGVTHIWFTMDEYVGNQLTRVFQKCRLFKKDCAHFSEAIHEDDTFEGLGAFFGWKVIHRKTIDKQVRREMEYLQTYKKLLMEGKITQEWFDRITSFHYFVKVPHG